MPLDSGPTAGRTLLTGLAALLALSVTPTRGVAQEPRGLEAGLEAVTALADPAFAGAGLSAALRPGGGARVVLSVQPGVECRRLAGRGELIGHLLLTPAKVHGVGFYGLAGVAGQVGRREAGWLVLGVGLERASAARSGWHIEAGIGGGARISVGWRWRWLRVPGTELP